MDHGPNVNCLVSVEGLLGRGMMPAVQGRYRRRVEAMRLEELWAATVRPTRSSGGWGWGLARVGICRESQCSDNILHDLKLGMKEESKVLKIRTEGGG